jgi:hypothetical protein
MVYAGDNGCPKDHPRVFPRLFIHAKYDTSLGADSKLATAAGEDPAHADPATGFHADYIEAWKTDAAFSDPAKGTRRRHAAAVEGLEDIRQRLR